MLRKEDYTGWEDQDLCNKYWKEAVESMRKNEWVALRAQAIPAQDSQVVISGRKGSTAYRNYYHQEEFDVR